MSGFFGPPRSSPRGGEGEGGVDDVGGGGGGNSICLIFLEKGAPGGFISYPHMPILTYHTSNPRRERSGFDEKSYFERGVESS